MMYLLDTNACIEVLRNRNVLIVQRINARTTQEIKLCSVVTAELFYGCLRSNAPSRNRAKVDAFIRPYSILPFDIGSADVFAQIRVDLESKGTPIGPYDLQIAAIALHNKLTLVTHNTTEFRRVNGLICEDWQIP